MSTWRRWLAQALLYGLFALAIGVLSHWPAYQALAPDQALVKVSFIHHGQRLVPCRPYTPEELAKLAPNMRTPLKCERERAPVEIEVELDGALVYRHVAQPSGTSRDGASSVYHRMAVAAGPHRVRVRLKDGPGAGALHTREVTLRLAPAQVLVIDFDPQKGGITFT